MTEITFDRDRLAAAVAFAARALPRNAMHPTLNGLRLTGSAGGVLVSAFDYDTYAEANAGPGSTTFDVLLPGRVFASYLAGMTGPQVRGELTGDAATLSCGAAKVTLRTLSLDDYPSPPPLPTSVGTVPAPALAAALAYVKDSVGVGEGVAPLEGIRVEAVDGVLTAAGISRYRLAVRDVHGWAGDSDFAATLPLPAADVTKSLAGDVVVGFDSGRVSFGDADRCLMVRTVDGEPPRWRTLLDNHSGSTTVSLDRAGLADAVRWVTVGSSDRKPFCRFEVGDGAVEVTLGGADGLDASTAVEAKVDGDGMAVGFGADYLIDVLAATDAATVTLSLAAPSKAALLTAETDPGFRALVMPVKLT